MNDRMRELDSLRGVAIILVMAFHIFKRAGDFTHNQILNSITNLTSVGWIGVDIFFALSGFLITSILLRTKNEENYYKNFYVRRVLRIFPLYYVTLTIILILMPVLDPAFTSKIPSSLPYLLLYMQNWIYIWGHITLTPFLGVIWSLAIEEQFYFIWPSIVYFTSKETLAKVGIGIIMLSILARVVGFFLIRDTQVFATFFYYNTFTRFEELVFGALLAVAVTYPAWKERLRLIALPVFLVALSAFIVMCRASFPYIIPYYGNVPLTIGGFTLVALFSTALIAIFVTHPERSIIRRLFQGGVLSFFGKYSYSMYLLHLPVALLLEAPLWDTRLRGWKMYLTYIVLCYGCTVIGSLLTWNLLEKHILNLKKYFEYKHSNNSPA